MAKRSWRSVVALGLLCSVLIHPFPGAAADEFYPHQASAVRPLLKPIAVRYSPTGNVSARYTVLVQSRVNDTSLSEAVSLDVDLSVAEVAGQLVTNYKLGKTTIAGVTLEAEKSIFEGTRKTDKLGNVLSVEALSPYAEYAGRSLSKEDQARLERDLERSVAFPVFNQEPVSFGDRVFTRPAQELFDDALPAFDWQGEIVGIAAGLITLDDRENLVVVHWGHFEGRHGDTVISGGVSGQSLIDLKTGLRTGSTVNGLLGSALPGQDTSLLVTISTSASFSK